MIRTARWTMGNVVLLGDAKSTAHFSIGAGTKLAMEDAIALFESFRARTPDVPSALAQFESDAPRGGRAHAARGRRVAGVVRACRAVLAHGPGAVRVRADDAGEVDHLRQSAPARAGFRRCGGPHVRAQVPRAGSPAAEPLPPMFQPFALRGMALANRVVVSPMCMYSAAGRPAERFPPRALRQPRAGRCGAAVHRDDVRRRRGAHHARLRGAVVRCAGGGVDAHRRVRARARDCEDLPAARPCRPQGRDQADVGGHGPAAGARRLADRGALRPALLPGQPVAARDDAGRHGRACATSSWPPPQRGRCAPGSTCWSCTARTAICSAASSRR